ncbi:hypothetical protein MMB232_03180 [Brevundimonas subvibrioides]|uniref:FkbM family methyltransferase n=1 Tax=Brevundimonas subvibrioides TaxID=74313 RepID=UPI0032D5699E
MPPVTIDSTELVTALYEHILGRTADGLAEEKARRLAAGEVSANGLVREFAVSDEYQNRILEHQRFTADHTQFGEFEILLKRLCMFGCSSRTVVDVGARGRARSNSYDLMNVFGWRGILIEANPRLIPEIRADFAGLDLGVIECAVSDYEGSARFHIGINDDVSSLSRESAGAWGEVQGEIEVQVRRLEGILVEMGVPHDFGVLSIDLEGEDVKVLNDLIGGGRYLPQWVIIEASHDFSVNSLRQLPVIPRVLDTYRIVGQTRANLILERQTETT